MGERRRFPASACLLALAAVVVLQAAVVVLVLGEASDGGALLVGPRQLEKFVDEMPDMPRLRGYGVTERGALVADNLTIGMYDTSWVSARNIHVCMYVRQYVRAWLRAQKNAYL
ncbi:multicopper oxidase LPR1 homolog 2-like [Zea mays]|uniref:multicopper oxidase LPR1 homolog 2-like n=1 Tax=Zea mays TaxID=4577 RepID=UPI001651B71C|nr:multicopper oxidase LPR1 homolog 2-like [Zea mays]